MPVKVKLFVVVFWVIRRPATPIVTPPTVRFELIVMSKLLTDPPLITMPVLPGLLPLAVEPRATFAEPSPLAEMEALPVRQTRSDNDPLAAAYMTFKLVAETLTPPIDKFENVVVAFKLVSDPLETTMPGEVEFPSTSETERLELKPSAALP